MQKEQRMRRRNLESTAHAQGVVMSTTACADAFYNQQTSAEKSFTDAQKHLNVFHGCAEGQETISRMRRRTFSSYHAQKSSTPV